MKICVLGYGARGKIYTDFFSANETEIVAVCDIKEERLRYAKESYNLDDSKLFNSIIPFFEKGKLADLCIVATPDAMHKEHAISAMKVGYDLLLEKPIAVTEEDCKEIQDIANSLKRKVFVCHVLRYAPFFATIKREIESGKYGKVSTINLSENVAYWHQAHSYVRGNWRRKDLSSPMIIAKCCHDLDLLSWFVDAKCINVSSMGSLGYFTKENAPLGSADRCLDCAVKDDCAYDAERFYIKERLDVGMVEWPVNVLALKPTKQNITEALKTTNYGKCVYKLDNDVVDHQIVNMEFKDGITAHLTMTAFSKDSYREIHVHCEKGEIFGSMVDNVLHCNVFGKSSETININEIQDNSYGHGGGDVNMVLDIINYYKGNPVQSLTDIDRSMQSHIIGFSAETSRLSGGDKITL